MKYILSFLLIFLLAGCQYTASHAVNHLEKGVGQCCRSLCISGTVSLAPANEYAEPVPAFPASVLDINSGILTW